MYRVETELKKELIQIQSECMDWITLDEDAYVHIGSDDSASEQIIQVVGLARAEMGGSNVLWLL
jgi:hypothetical protein